MDSLVHLVEDACTLADRVLTEQEMACQQPLEHNQAKYLYPPPRLAVTHACPRRQGILKAVRFSVTGSPRVQITIFLNHHYYQTTRLWGTSLL